MPTRSTRVRLVLIIGIVLAVNSFAATGIVFAEPADERQTDGYSGSEPIDYTGSEPVKSTSDAIESSSSSDAILSTASATVTSVVLLAGYNRSGDSDPLEHDVRKEVHDTVHESSGIYVSDLRETCDIHRSTLRYHLEVLEREDLLDSETMFGKRWYYPADSDVGELRAALTHDPTGEILEALARLEPVSVTELASEVDRSSSTVSYHLERLENEGMIEQERGSTTVLSQLAPDVRTELERSANPADSTRD